jgi:hypothetical protein
MPKPRPRWERAYNRLWSDPKPWPFAPDSKQGVCTETRCVFSFKDRLRIMFGGIVTVRIVSETEFEPGTYESASVTWVGNPANRPPRREQGENG